MKCTKRNKEGKGLMNKMETIYKDLKDLWKSQKTSSASKTSSILQDSQFYIKGRNE